MLSSCLRVCKALTSLALLHGLKTFRLLQTSFHSYIETCVQCCHLTAVCVESRGKAHIIQPKEFYKLIPESSVGSCVSVTELLVGSPSRVCQVCTSLALVSVRSVEGTD